MGMDTPSVPRARDHHQPQPLRFRIYHRLLPHHHRPELPKSLIPPLSCHGPLSHPPPTSPLYHPGRRVGCVDGHGETPLHQSPSYCTDGAQPCVWLHVFSSHRKSCLQGNIPLSLSFFLFLFRLSYYIFIFH